MKGGLTVSISQFSDNSCSCQLILVHNSGPSSIHGFFHPLEQSKHDLCNALKAIKLLYLFHIMSEASVA